MRTRMVVLVVVVALLGLGGGLWWGTRGDDAPRPVAAVSDAASAPKVQTPPRPLSPEAQQVTDQQEQDERAQVEAIATERTLTPDQRERLIAILGEMQSGRRALFADLAARAIAVEEVSSKLRDLREAMHAAFAKEVGDEHAKAIRDRMRVAHGGEPKN